MSLLKFHAAWAWVVIASTFAAGVWALLAHKFAAFDRREFWWFAYAAHATIVVQVTIGVIAQNRSEVEAPSTHLFYGFVGLASVGIIFSYRQQLEQWRYLLYGFGSLFLMGLAMRSFFLV